MAKLTKAEQQALDKIYQQADKAPPAPPEPLKVENYGPIKSMTLGDDWKDQGIWPRSENPLDKSHGGNRYKHHDYRLVNADANLCVYFDPKPQFDERAAKTKNIVNSITGAVPKEKWSELSWVFGPSANLQFFTIHSVNIIELAEKKIIVMTGVLKRSGTQEKSIYVSLDGNWNNFYNFVMAIAADENFETTIAEFDKALKTVVWKKE